MSGTSDPYIDLSVSSAGKAMTNDYGLGFYITGTAGDAFIIAIGSKGGSSCELLGKPGSCTTVSSLDIVLADASAQPNVSPIGDIETAVPEAASIALLGAVLAGLGLLRRRKRG